MGNLSNTPFRKFKRWNHEGGITTPLIFYRPRVIREGRAITHQMGHLIDVMATSADVAGADHPSTHNGCEVKPLEGKSLLPIFQGKQRVAHETLCWEWSGNRAIRQGKWKCVWDKLVQEWELYDVVADRTETRDLAEQDPERTAAMVAAWKAWAKQTGVSTRNKKSKK